MFDETTGTLFCGDLLTQLGDVAPLVDDDVLEASAMAEDIFGATCLTPTTAPTIRRLAGLGATTLATMHGSTYNGDTSATLLALADSYDERLLAANSTDPSSPRRTRMTSVPAPPTDRRRERHLARRSAIVAEAWALARRDGLAAISLRDLADQVGLRQPSLYAYFDSKLALYDAMFADGNRQIHR